MRLADTVNAVNPIDTPHFTILVAVYNAEAWLPRCLDSLLGQTERSLEVLCIDDGSTDGSADVVRRYAEADGRIRLLRTPQNSGQAVARNIGLAEARGVLTTMVDADDWLEPDSLASLWEAFSAEPEADAVAFRLVYWQDGREWFSDRTEQLPRTMDGREACRKAIDWTLHGYYAIRTDIHKALPYDASCRLYSDDNTSRIHYLHCRRVVMSDGRYVYRQHPANSTRQLTRRRFDFVAANDSLRRLLEGERDVDAGMLRICEDYVWRNYVGVWRQAQGPCSLSPDERREVEALLRDTYAHVKSSRLPWRTRLHPSFMRWPSYRIFCIMQRLMLRRHK